MNSSIIAFLCLFIVASTCKGLRVLGPSGPLSVQPGDSVVLPCYVETPIPTEELEVEWRRTDSETVVHLFQDGESRPEAQAQVYHDRTHFFTEEVTHGNFSLLLKDVTTEDTGVYKCVVHRNQESSQTLIEIKMSEYLVVSGGHVVSAYAGEEATLNCSVHSHIPPEEIEQISWKQKDQDIVVLLFVKGQIKPESTHERYRDRVELFNPEEMHKGNFSLRLKNLRIEDKGVYMCEALHKKLSASTTVEVLQLGLSSIHIAVLFLCACVCLCGTSPLLYTLWPHKEDDNRVMKVQYALTSCTTFFIFPAFILWGQIEGIFSEVAVCSAVNLMRILRLLYYSPFTSENIKILTALEWLAVSAAIYSVLWRVIGTEFKIMMAVVGAILLFIIISFVLGAVLESKLPYVILVCVGFLFRISRGFLFGLSLISVFFIINWRGDEKDKMGLIFENVLLIILTVLAYTELWFSDSEKMPKALVFKLCMCGTAVLFVMNSITLSTELILSARNGKRTIQDLQLILLPFEWVFAFGYIIVIYVVELSKQKEDKKNGKDEEDDRECEEEDEEEEEEAGGLTDLNGSTSTPLDPAESWDR